MAPKKKIPPKNQRWCRHPLADEEAAAASEAAAQGDAQRRMSGGYRVAGYCEPGPVQAGSGDEDEES
jgi:hypothetical protein